MDLPKPTVDVAERDGYGYKGIDVTVSRDGKSRTWSGTSSTTQGAVRDAVEKMLDDHHTAEYVK